MDLAEQLGIKRGVHELKLGSTLVGDKKTAFHTMKYDFKPASVEKSKMATVSVEEHNNLTVTIPRAEGSGTSHTVFKGSQKPHQKEYILIIDKVTGEITLERLSSNIQVKRTRDTPAAPVPNLKHEFKPISQTQKIGTVAKERSESKDTAKKRKEPSHDQSPAKLTSSKKSRASAPTPTTALSKPKTPRQPAIGDEAEGFSTSPARPIASSVTEHKSSAVASTKTPNAGYIGLMSDSDSSDSDSAPAKSTILARVYKPVGDAKSPKTTSPAYSPIPLKPTAQVAPFKKDFSESDSSFSDDSKSNKAKLSTGPDGFGIGSALQSMPGNVFDDLQLSESDSD